MQVIDSHIHVVDFGGPLPRMLEQMREGYARCGYDAICFAVNTSEGFHAIHRNLLASLYKLRYPEHGYVFAGLDYHLPGSNSPEWDFALQARRLADMGADGFKMYEGKPNARKACGNIPLTSPRYQGFYDLLEERGLPLAIHLADPPEFWDASQATAYQVEKDWFFGDATFSTWQEIYDEIMEVIGSRPNLKIILPQFGFLPFDFPRLEALLRRYPNLIFDVAPAGNFGYLEGKEAAAFKGFAQEFNNRLLFACTGVSEDLGETAKKAKRLLDGISRLGLSQKAETAILKDNFLALCPPRPVDKKALREYTAAVKKSITGFPAADRDRATVKRTMEIVEYAEQVT